MGIFLTDFSHMWLSWRGVPNRIKIDSTPRLRLKITKYGEKNEILFLETDMGNYRPKIKEVLMLQSPVKEIEENQDILNSTEVVVESDHDTNE